MRNYFKWLFSYKWHAGSMAWLLMRLTGIGLVIYLGLHLIVISYFSQNEQVFRIFLASREHIFIKILECLLVFSACYHALGGLRLILMDLGIGLPWQKQLFAGVLILSLFLTTVLILA